MFPNLTLTPFRLRLFRYRSDFSKRKVVTGSFSTLETRFYARRGLFPTLFPLLFFLFLLFFFLFCSTNERREKHDCERCGVPFFFDPFLLSFFFLFRACTKSLISLYPLSLLHVSFLSIFFLLFLFLFIFTLSFPFSHFSLPSISISRRSAYPSF